MIAERGLIFHDQVDGVEANGSAVWKCQPQHVKERDSAPVDNHPLHATTMLLAEYSFQLRPNICGRLLVDQKRTK